MFNGFDLSTISDAKIGNTQINQIFYGSTLIWPTTPPPHDYSQDYLTIVSLEDNNTIGWRKVDYGAPTKTISVSTDGGLTWTQRSSDTTEPVGTVLATLNTGDKLLVKGNNSSYGYPNLYYTYMFDSTGTFDVEGNIMSLIYGDNFIGQTTLTEVKTFIHIFYNCKLINANNLILPATTLTNSCYHSLFSGCTLLINAPELIYATTIPTGAYSEMFMNCLSLNYIKCLATDISATNCLQNWVQGVAATGTFVKDANTTWPTGSSGIPANWTVVNN